MPSTTSPTFANRTYHLALAALCLTQVTSWGIVFYAFPVLASSIATGTGWSTSVVMGAFSAGLAVSAIAGVPVGRILDRLGPRPVMTVGSVLAVVSLVGVSIAPTAVWFAMAWALSGIAQAGVLYKPAVAAVTVWFGSGRVKALMVLMLAGGLASTVFAPITAALINHLSWRETYLVLAIVLAVITIPLHAVFLRVPWPRLSIQSTTKTSTPSHQIDRVASSPRFIILAASFAIGAFAMFTALICLVPLLTEQGMTTTVAAWALGLSGFGQVVGRLGYEAFVKHTSVTARTVWIFVGAGVTTVAVGLFSSPVSVVMVLVLLMGVFRGAFSLLEATAVSDRWGSRSFGLRYGLFSLPSTMAIAMSPWVGTVLALWLGSYSTLFWCLGISTVVAVILAAATAYRPSQRGRAPSIPALATATHG